MVGSAACSAAAKRASGSIDSGCPAQREPSTSIETKHRQASVSLLMRFS